MKDVEVKFTNGNCYKNGSEVNITIISKAGFKGRSLVINGIEIINFDNNIEGIEYKTSFNARSYTTKGQEEQEVYLRNIWAHILNE